MTGTKHYVFAFWFDSNKELDNPFLGTRVLNTVADQGIIGGVKVYFPERDGTERS